MAGRRILYLATLLGSLVFCYFYQEWFAVFLLTGVVLLPVLSLLISLPAMLTVQVELQCPDQVVLKAPAVAKLRLSCGMPQPPVRCRLRLQSSLTGESAEYALGEQLATEHCGLLRITLVKGWIYDYLGLFRRQIREEKEYTLLVMPKPVRTGEPPQLRQYMANAWRPKRGGGFSENHELRLYRPGDDLRQIHWKLAAKTGSLILREPMEALRGGAVLSLELSGSEDVLDKKLGKLLWLSRYLLDHHLPHEILCLTGDGTVRFSVADEGALKSALAALLASPVAHPGQRLPQEAEGAWHYRIGGDADAV